MRPAMPRRKRGRETNKRERSAAHKANQIRAAAAWKAPSGKGQRRDRERVGRPEPGAGVQVNERERRIMIMCAWIEANRPGAADVVGRDGLANYIWRQHPRLFPGRNSVRDVILPALLECVQADEEGRDYTGKRRKGSGGHNIKMRVEDCRHDNAMAAAIVQLNKGMSLAFAVGRANLVRDREGGKRVQKDTIRRVRDELGGKVRAVASSAQGSRDENSAASLAWVQFGTQIGRTFEEGAKKKTGRKRKATKLATASAQQGSTASADHESFGKLTPYNVLHADQHHGSMFEVTRRKQTSVPICPKTGRPLPEAMGGVMPPAFTKRKVKYPGQVRADLGVAVVKDAITGEVRGEKTGTFFYHGAGQGTLEYLHKYDIALAREKARVRVLKKGPKGGASVWAKFNGPNPYQERWPDDWQERIKKVGALSQLTDIRELMDWTLAEGKRIFKGTTAEHDWRVMRDGLKQWWMPDAQAHAKEIGLYERQIRCTGSTNVGTAYEGKVPGDQHTASILDDNLFAKYKFARAEHVHATFDLPKGDPAKFSMCTPKLGQACFERVWQVCPTSEDIVANSARWPGAIKKIVDNKGMLVEKQKAHGQRQQRGYLGVLHPDAQAAVELSEDKFG